ncbi:MAG TPA: cytochrome c [Pyrinomonadaceae bacterium]|nr:cytochrome c [Pyrinomonadaceae bacterium]
MKLTLLVLTCVAFALLSLACTETTTTTNTPSAATAASPAGPAAPAAPADPLAIARTNYAKHCEGCHGPAGEGGPVKVDEKTIRVPSLKAPHAVRHSDEELTNIVTNGEEAMPAFKDKLSQEEITHLVHLVRTEFQKKN